MLKELMKCIREYKKPSILAPVLVSLEVVMECTIPFLIAMLVNQIKAGAEFSVLVKYGLLLIVMATLSLMFGIGAGNACATASCGFAKNVRKDLYAKIQEFSFENIDKFSSSSLVTRLTTDVTNVQNAYMMIVRIAVRCPLMFLFAFVMAFIMGGKMACIFLLVVPVLGFGLYMVIRTAMPLFRKVFHKYDELNNSIQENIKGMRVVKSYVREDFEKEKFDRAAGDVCEDFTKAEKILAWNNPLMQFSLYTVMIFVLTVGSYVIITTKGLDLDVGQFSALLTYSFQILSSLMMLSMVFVMVTLANESAHRIVEVLKEESSLTFCYCDLDHLKYINDQYGHTEGDWYITFFVETIQKHIRKEDVFARIGGDEFCVILYNCPYEMAERKIRKIQKEFSSGQTKEYPKSFSCGIVEVEGGNEELQVRDIIKQADHEMYLQKKEHKKKYRKELSVISISED